MSTTRTTNSISGTVPQLGDAANIETAFNSYHDSLANTSTGVAALNRANDFTGNIAINNGTSTALTTTGTTAALFNTNATTLNIGGVATTLTIGATTGTATIRNATVAITNAATIGTTLSVTGNTTLTGDLAVNGGDLTTNQSSFNLLTTPTTITIGADTGNVNFRDNISAEGYITARRATNQDSVRLIGRAGGTGNYDAIITTDTLTATRTLTLPNATTTLVGTDATQTLTNKTLTSPDINAGTADSLTSLSIRDTSAAYDVTIAATSSTTLTAGRTLTLDVVNAARTIKLGGNITTAGAFITSGAYGVTLTATGTTNVTLPTSGTLVNSAVTTLSSLANIGTVLTGTWNGSVVAGQYGGTGVANTGKTITVSGNTTIGSSTHTVAFATSGNTSVTLPTSGTIESRPYRLFLASDVTDSISTSTSTTKTSAALGKYVTATTNTAYKIDFALHIYHSLAAPTANGDSSLSFRFALPSGTLKADFDYRLDTAAEDTASSVSSVYEEVSSSSTDIIAIKTINSTSDNGYTVIRGSGIIRTGASGGSIGPTLYLSASNVGNTSSVSFTTAADSYCIIQPIGTTGEINTGEWA